MLPFRKDSLAGLLVSVIMIISCKGSLKPNPLSQITKIVQTQSDINIQLASSLRSQKLKPLTVHVKYDHFFKTAKVYNGYLINTLLDSVIRVNNFDTTEGLLVFECSDGYKPVMELSKIYGNTKGYIVFKDLDNRSKENWADSIKDKFYPYYLVWDDVEKNDDSFMWPYGLVAIKLTSANLMFKDAYPSNRSLRKGFNLFRTHCMKCHSINNVGGTMAPEFNIPKNITEYWNEEDIIQFAKNPKAYRNNTHMPGLPMIENPDFKEIVSYLKYMKDFKIKE